MTQDLTIQLKAEALRIGFDRVGICPAITPPGFDHLHEWLARGYAGDMDYIGNREAAYANPDSILAGARSVAMLTVNYRTELPAMPIPGTGKISRYAWGSVDYHDWIQKRLKSIVHWFDVQAPDARARGVVDTAPLMERQFAQLAGLGWQGKNTLLLSPTSGSLYFLAAVVTDLELDYDEPFVADHCGTCTACLDACPTKAFPQPYVLDASRCISYLTIEKRGALPETLRTSLDGWLFGCDVCQDVCPWNSKAPATSQPEFAPQSAHNPVDLCALLDLSEAQLRARFRRTPVWRTKRSGLFRNAILLLGTERYLPAESRLIAALADIDATVRGAAVWALARLATESARIAITKRLEIETDADVLAELRGAAGA